MQLALLKKLTLFLFLLVGVNMQAYAQLPFTENFNSFTGTGFAPIPAAGQLDSDVWKVTGFSEAPKETTFGGTSATSGDFARGLRSTPQTTGGIYSFDIGGGNTTLGVQPGSNDFNPGTIVARIQNNTGVKLTSLVVSYDIYCRNDQGRASSFNFSYSIKDESNYTDVTDLDFTSVEAADPSPSWQFVTRTTTLTGLSIDANDYIYVRWTGNGVSGNGSRDEFALDNVSVTSPLPTTLFFSEYVEGSGNNRALEIYNPSTTPVDLGAGSFTIEKYSNGSSTMPAIINLTGTISAKGTFIIASNNTATDVAIKNVANQTSGSIDFTGDDAILLKQNGTIIDVIGQLGNDPGEEWGTGLVSTKDNTLRRKCGVTTGKTDPTVVFDPSLEWDGFAINIFDGLGAHCPTAVIDVTATLTAFSTTALNTPSAEQTYTITSSNLTSDLVITAPSAFEIEVSAGTFNSTFGTSPATVPFALANVNITTVKVRYKPSSGTSHTDNITNESTGAATKNVAVTGTAPLSLIDIAAARTRPVDEIVMIEGVLTVSNQLGGPAFIQDATGGIAVFDSQIHGGAFPIGQRLRITAKRADFNNQIQLTNITALTDLGAGTPVVPQVITLNQLDANRGKLVKIVDVTFPNPNAFLFGNSNYAVTNGANSADVRIDGDTDLAGRTQPTTCDVVGVVAYFQTASQLIPRFQSDLPCTTPYVSPTASTVTACSPTAKTLEVSSFNIEWFGDEGNSPAGANADVVQKNAAKAIIKSSNSDIYTLVEIVDVPLMAQLAAELTAETPDTWDILFSDFASAGTNPQKLGFLYKTNVIQPIFSYAMLQSIHPNYNGGNDAALVNYPDINRSRFWASGRLPFWMRANVTLNGSTEEIDFIVIHGRANNSSDAQGRYDMRRYDVTVLEDSIRNNSMLVGRKIIMGGDYNDDVDVTVANITSTITSFEAFTTRPTEYTILSKELSDNDFRSTIGFTNMIDHLMVSNELTSAYIPNSVSVGYEYYDANYERTTSDHFMVSARLEIVPIVPCRFGSVPNSPTRVNLNWTDNSNIENSYVIESSLDGVTGWTPISGSPFAANTTTATATGLTGGTKYFFRLRAEESTTNVSEWIQVTSTTAATPIGGGGGGGTNPSIITSPTNFKAVATSTSQINLTWDAVSSATGYVIYRGSAIVANLGTVTSFEHTELTPDTFYEYRLVARNGTLQSSTVVTNARTLPAAPSLLSVTNACSGSGGTIRVASTGVIYRIYANSTSTTPLFEVDNSIITTPSITEMTTYYISVVSNGKESERTLVTVNANPLPTANIIEDRIISCSPTSTITAQTVLGASYTWLVNGSAIATTTTATYQVTRSGDYQVRVTLNGCSVTSDITPVSLSFTPLADIVQGTIVRSCESTTTISAKDAGTEAIYNWTRGNVVLGNTASLSVSQSGTYTLTVTQNGCSATDEIVVEVSTISPDVSFTASQITFCPEEEVTLRVNSPQQDVTYTWVFEGRVLRNVTGVEYKVSVAGTYRVEASQNSCTVLSTPITITRTNVAPVYLRNEDNVLRVESITPITDVVWLLDGKENTALAGQMSFTPTVSGYYSANVIFNTGCKGSTTRTVYYAVPDPVIVTGEENIIDVETIVYPNPSHTGIFRVQLSNSITSDVTFTIIDNIGRVLENKVVKANEISTLQTLDLSQYAAGMYALTIDTEQGKVIKKIIIE